ncbi:MAG: hypothetical protein UX99_C0007G0021 [Candidatus Amesbacteria bacterium GW2011_GWB1_47_26]|uniref:Uncharacterized protein n=1 Tax=Candidatus Amesbacteria bacterium GW2011_GWC2_45_19 TaxID=1618366 RepID=A0A0G1M2R3_9BACT|nr:MAG: hypothetical protein UX05_C0012G0003 [Candidatus Amesbacteria bacterium GW2011_GWC2_45_19]KKU38074.1 MAG: hypothetical protein UX52_C0011G0004 [Candidatus Amesbacteria bacterium GW2011_GWA1_46_35]KKU69047.1 MAG: hypothetical protein UX93_C0003G0039 [Microgenomates group bacterium GW2011_GWC1_47_20]KKU74733.1 MAG: hypothetical protein UX99_C0007G0021 [Candidatus Amesbacteria bacterium GW2011_GWB1_47_26]KKU79761.1 MAG: hypothetical protein UY06_C0014G0002 [Candidatus Amesbacteria bacteriu
MKKAFTLIELLIYMAMVGLFLVILTNMLATILETQAESAAVSVVDIDGRYILARLGYDANNVVLNPQSYSVVDGNLQVDEVRLNSYDSIISGWSVTRVDDTARVNFSIASGDRSRTFSTAVGIR